MPHSGLGGPAHGRSPVLTPTPGPFGRLLGAFYTPFYFGLWFVSILRIYGFEGEPAEQGEGFTRTRESNRRRFFYVVIHFVAYFFFTLQATGRAHPA